MNKKTKTIQTKNKDARIRNVNGRDIFEISPSKSSGDAIAQAQKVIRIPHVVGDRYQVTDFLSKGGQGVVFVAEDLTMNRRKVLIKMSLFKDRNLGYGLEEGDWAPLQEENLSLQREAKQLLEIRERGESRAPCLVRLVKDVYADAWVHPSASSHTASDYTVVYLVMQYLPGVTLKDKIKQVKEGRVPNHSLTDPSWWRQCVHWTRQLASILENLHKFNSDGEGLIYCDLKPDNCVVSNRDISLIDFGALKTFNQDGSEPGGVFTTAGYCAPETHNDLYSGELTGKVDVYSVGAMLWAMLSGDKPTQYCVYDNRSPDLLSVQGALPEGLPDSIMTIMIRCLERDPERRINAFELKKLCREAIKSL